MNNFYKKIKNPVQYLGLDINTVKKEWHKVNVKFLLAFPDLYEIGSSNLGIQILYHIINSFPKYLCDRIFAPDIPKNLLLEKKIPYVSLDNGKLPADFDIIGFSLQYEMSYPTVLSMLEFMGIPLFADERLHNNEFPLICAGGATVFNPLPMEPYFDFFLIGDGEEAVIEKCRIIESMKNEKKINVLEKLSEIEGFYSPFFKNKTVKRRILKKFKDEFIPVKPVVPITKTVHNRAVIEISRGCARGCRFCQAGIIYRPVREKSIEQIVDSAFNTVNNTGYGEIGLLSLSVGDYSQLALLIENVKTLNCSLSMPSIRADKVSSEILGYISEREKTGFTIAPEAGSERLRRIINKNLSEADIIQGVEKVFKSGWQLIKLYFMIGLPFETDNDILDMINLTIKLNTIAKSFSKRNRITVSISPFVPKPHTPFQWFGANSIDEIKRKLDIIKDRLKKFGRIKFKWHNPETSLIEAVISRGDTDISKLIFEAYKQGAYLDAWTDRFDFSKWERAAVEAEINLNKYAEKKFGYNDKLPWDFIDIGVKKEFLKEECIKAEKALQTDDCRFSGCNGCGICGHGIKNVLYSDNIKTKKVPVFKKVNFEKVIFRYRKKGYAALIGHIDLTNIIVKALLRTGASFKFSEGFKPKMKISFSPPPPFGVESLEEFFEVSIDERVKPSDIIASINTFLPKGVEVTGCFSNTEHVNLNKDILACCYIIHDEKVTIPQHPFVEFSEIFNGKTRVKIRYDNGKHLNIVKTIAENNSDIDVDNLLIVREKFFFKNLKNF